MKGYKLTFIFLFFLPFTSFAAPHFGTTLSYVAIAKEPTPLHGYQFLFNYDPELTIAKQWSIYFDGGLTHLWVPGTSQHSTINIYTLAPVLRCTLFVRDQFTHYLDLSIGLAYLNHTWLGNRNLGLHFAFQDRIGIGALLGKMQQFSIGLHAMHYSNASLSSHNSGITIPLTI